MIERLTQAGQLTFPPFSFPVGNISTPTSRSNDDVRKDLTVPAYKLPKGSETETHLFFDFSQPEYDDNGEEVYLTPTITTFYGHDLLPAYGVTITPYDEGRKIRLVLLTIHRADGDESKEITVPAWQGDNDTFHITIPLPDEDRDYGFVHRTVFGRPKNNTEQRDWTLGGLYYGETALLDIDISSVVTPGKALQA